MELETKGIRPSTERKEGSERKHDVSARPS